MGAVVWVFLNGAKHSLPAGFSAKSGVKNCEVTDLHKSIGILHFKHRRIQICQRFVHPPTFGGRENQGFDGKVEDFDAFRRLSQGKRTNRNLPHRYLESPRSNLYSSVPFASRTLEIPCYRRVVFTNFGGNFGISQIPENFNLELILKGLELPESHWTSPLGPL